VTSESEALARAAYDALNRRDLDAWADAFHPDVEATSLIMDVDGVVYRGREGMRALAEDMVGVFADYRVELKEFRDIGDDKVITSVHVSGTGDESGVPLEADGLFWKGAFHRTEHEALAAIGAESG
jgi:ketosteroid isomerase-like protein